MAARGRVAISTQMRLICGWPTWFAGVAPRMLREGGGSVAEHVAGRAGSRSGLRMDAGDVVIALRCGRVYADANGQRMARSVLWPCLSLIVDGARCQLRLQAARR